MALDNVTICELKINDLFAPIGIDTATPNFSWKMKSKNLGAVQTAYNIIVADSKGTEVWNTNWVESSDSLNLPYGGDTLISSEKYTVKVAIKDEKGVTTDYIESYFETALFEADAFDDTKWISYDNTADQKVGNEKNLPAYRKEIFVKSGLKAAKLYVSGLGVFEAYLNGKRVSNLLSDGSLVYDELKPGYTNGFIRRTYNTYDLTHMINAGENNVLTGIVTDGWWSAKDGLLKQGEEPAFFAKLILIYDDGTKEAINTDQSFKTARVAPLQVGTTIYHGEKYDATVDTSWMMPNYDDSNWSTPKINTEFVGKPYAQAGAFVKIRKDLERTPQKITLYEGATDLKPDFYGKINTIAEYKSGDDIVLNPNQNLLIDFGQNIAGWENLNLTSEGGTVVTVRHAEMLNDGCGAISRGNDGPEGSIYTASYRSAAAKTVYVTAGGEKEAWHPSFSFYGFRYVEITVSKPTTIHLVTASVVSSVFKDTAQISTSNNDINQLISNVKWGMYGNYLSVPTDCPQRDERLGWLADTQIFAQTGLYLGDNKAFLRKFLTDIRDGQMLDKANADYGGYPAIAPNSFDLGCHGNYGWADCGIILPYYLYMMSGDTSIITEMWSSMRLYMDEFLSKRKYGGNTIFCDWLAYEPRTDIGNQMLGISFIALDALMMISMANAIGETAAAEHYTKVYNRQKELYKAEFVNEDGSLKHSNQAVCLYALYTDLVDNTEAVINQLVANIEGNNNKLQTGFLGTAIIMTTLTKVGRVDIAYKLLLQHENPSWLYSVDQGATTIWERWNSYTVDDGFGDVSMNSFNHYAYGAVLGWMFSNMAGIDFDKNHPGFKHIILSPKPNASIKTVNASYNSPYGEIVSNMAYEGENWLYNATVPANTTATIKIPVQNGSKLLVNSKDANEVNLLADGIEYSRLENGFAIFNAVAGSFSFLKN